MHKNKLSFKEALLNPDALSVTWELTPGKGAFEKSQETVLKMVEQAAKDKRINGITITDNPGGRAAMLPYPMAVEAKRMGIDPVIHFTCKDKNRNSIQSDLYALERAGLYNLLVMTGDYQVEGYSSCAQKVFDLDAVHAVKMVKMMNAGEKTSGRVEAALKPTHFFPGVVVSPFKMTEAEQVTQYYKLYKKIKMGAEYVITQIGYDPRKFEELRIYMDSNNIRVPLVGNVFLLPYTVAKMISENKIPGSVISDALLKEIEHEKATFSRPKDAQLLRSAKLYAVLKGLKYDGVNLGGHGMSYEDVVYIMEKGEELSSNWEEIAEEFQALHKNGPFFYYYEKKPDSIWNSEKPVDMSKPGKKKFYPDMKMLLAFHKLVFDEKAPFRPLAKAVIKFIDRTPLKELFAFGEHTIKYATNSCRFCGDCAMAERSFLCPMASCPKQQRNGPCGGSFNGWCEVYPGKKQCIYVMAYDRLKTIKDKEKLKRDYIPPCDGSLYGTASWINNLMGRDFISRSDYIPCIEDCEPGKKIYKDWS